MIALPVRQRTLPHPRLYLKEEPEYRYSRIILTRFGFASLALASLLGILLFSAIAFLLRY